MEPSFLQILPQLGVGSLTIIALVWVTSAFLKEISKKDQLNVKREEIHLLSLHERDIAFRELEKEVRTKILDQLNQNSVVMGQSTSIMSRVLDRLDTDRLNYK